MYAIRESLKWSDAYIAKQYIKGEVIAIDRYLGKYQIIKRTAKPWYLIYRNLGDDNSILQSIMLGIFASLVFCARSVELKLRSNTSIERLIFLTKLFYAVPDSIE